MSLAKRYAQTVTACFTVGGLDIDVTVENLPFTWVPSQDLGTREEQAANAAAKWLWENETIAKRRTLALVWVNVSPNTSVKG